jgi:hypothetical protein
MSTITYEIPCILRDDDGNSVRSIQVWMLEYAAMDFNVAFDDETTMSTILHNDIPLALSAKALVNYRPKGLYVKATTDGIASDETIEEIRQWLCGQCSDGWGENGFEFDNLTLWVWERGVEPKVIGVE